MKVDQKKLMELTGEETPAPKKKRKGMVFIILAIVLCLGLAGSYAAWTTKDQWMGMLPNAGYETPAEEDLVFDTFE